MNDSRISVGVVGALSALLFSVAIALGLSSCGGDDKCLSDGENCSQSYLNANGLQGYTCCNGQTCREGTISGVLICRN